MIYNVYHIINLPILLLLLQNTADAHHTVRSVDSVQLLNKRLILFRFGTYHPLNKFASIIREQKTCEHIQCGLQFIINVTPLKLLNKYSLDILFIKSSSDDDSI